MALWSIHADPAGPADCLYIPGLAYYIGGCMGARAFRHNPALAIGL